VSASSVRTDEVTLPSVVRLQQAAPTEIACRALDVLVSAVLLLLLSPLFAAIAIAIRVDSPGSVLFRQRRFGVGLTSFTIYKFRTMGTGTSVDVHRDYVVGLIRNDGILPGKVDDGLYKLEADDRITPVGRVLRRLSLDELPQLWNVLRGDMSLVGPRPAIPYEVEYYPPDWCQRFSVKPGITGLWQVSGRNQLNFGSMVQLDLEYAQRRSLWLNLRILAKTPWVVANGKGAS
jgi:lipopolysaccharide/colanic/teichoic acid biosynthesis glycosyltransferase